MKYYTCEYTNGLFSGGKAFIDATDEADAKKQIRGQRSVTFKMETLKKISKKAFDAAQKKRG